MKILVFVFICLSSAALAQKKVDDDAVIRQKVELLRKAMIEPVSETLSSLLSPQLSYGHSSGVIDTKESLMSALISGETDFESIEVSSVDVTFSGNVALVRHRLNASLQMKGGAPSTVSLGVLLVWQKNKNEWQLLARQAFKL
jgi:hypothetical protein